MLFHARNFEPSKEYIDDLLKVIPSYSPEKGINQQLLAGIKDPKTLKTHLSFSVLGNHIIDTAKVSK